MFINGKKVKFPRYSSGELKLKHDLLKGLIKNNTISILYNNDELNLFELILIIKYYKNLGVEINLTLSYLPYQRMDHISEIEVTTLKLVAELFNSLDLNNLAICEPHANIDNFKNATKVSFVELILKKLEEQKQFSKETDILFFTDKGSLKRYGHLGKHFIVGEKVRDKQTGLIASYELKGDLKSSGRIIIIDDIISTGDTMICALEELQKQTKKPITIVAGHFEKNKYNKRLLKLEYVEKIYSTNSLTKRQSKKLKLFNVEELLYG